MTPPARPSAAEEAWLSESLELFGKSHGAALRAEIATRTSWLAVRCARRFSDRGEPLNDLVQVAHIGLMKAIDRFDASHGVPFGVFATPTILGELRRHFRDHTWSVHVPRRAQELRAVINTTTEQLVRALHRSPTVEELARHLGVSADLVVEALEANNAYRSFTLDPAKPGHVIAAEEKFDEILDQEMILKVLKKLPPRQRHVVYLRFFDELTQAQIAECIGTSQVHVGRLLAASLTQLRRHLASEQP